MNFLFSCVVLAFCWSLCVATDKLISVFAVIRHGARTMIYNEFSDITSDASLKSLGRLTNVGKRQEYLLGCYFSKRYSKLIKSITHHNQIYIRSSGLERTIESAQAFSLGLLQNTKCKSLSGKQSKAALPPINVQGLDDLTRKLGNEPYPHCQMSPPTHSGYAVIDYAFSPHMFCNSFAEDEKLLTQALEELDMKYATLYEKINEILPEHMRPKDWNADLCYRLDDNMYVVETSGTKLLLEMDDETRSLVKICSFESTYHGYMRSQLKNKLVAHVVLEELTKSFKMKDERKLTVLSLSDVHILSLLKIFQWRDIAHIPYASSLIFEVYNTTNSKGKSSLRVEALYNDKRLELRNGLSDYKKFIRFVESSKLKDYDDFMKNCRVDPIEELIKESHTDSTFKELITVLAISFALIFTYFIYKCSKKKHYIHFKAKQGE